MLQGSLLTPNGGVLPGDGSILPPGEHCGPQTAPILPLGGVFYTPLAWILPLGGYLHPTGVGFGPWRRRVWPQLGEKHPRGGIYTLGGGQLHPSSSIFTLVGGICALRGGVNVP